MVLGTLSRNIFKFVSHRSAQPARKLFRGIEYMDRRVHPLKAFRFSLRVFPTATQLDAARPPRTAGAATSWRITGSARKLGVGLADSKVNGASELQDFRSQR